jgi:hypothetical protein
MTARTVTLTCPAGHLTYVLPHAVPPLACPHCPHGIPCDQPLQPARPARKEPHMTAPAADRRDN